MHKWRNKGVVVFSLYDYRYGVCIGSNALHFKEEEGDEKGEVITIAVALLIICLLAPLWPACMTFRAIMMLD